MTPADKRPREWWIEFGGNPKGDKENYKRYVGAEPWSPPFPDHEVVHVIEYSAYEQVVKERDEARAACDSLEGQCRGYHQALIMANGQRDQERAKSARLVEALKEVVRICGDEKRCGDHLWKCASRAIEKYEAQSTPTESTDEKLQTYLATEHTPTEMGGTRLARWCDCGKTTGNWTDCVCENCGGKFALLIENGELKLASTIKAEK